MGVQEWKNYKICILLIAWSEIDCSLMSDSLQLTASANQQKIQWAYTWDSNIVGPTLVWWVQNLMAFVSMMMMWGLMSSDVGYLYQNMHAHYMYGLIYEIQSCAIGGLLTRAPGEIKRSRDLRGGRWSWTLTFAQKRWSWAEQVGRLLRRVVQVVHQQRCNGHCLSDSVQHSSW